MKETTIKEITFRGMHLIPTLQFIIEERVPEMPDDYILEAQLHLPSHTWRSKKELERLHTFTNGSFTIEPDYNDTQGKYMGGSNSIYNDWEKKRILLKCTIDGVTFGVYGDKKDIENLIRRSGRTTWSNCYLVYRNTDKTLIPILKGDEIYNQAVCDEERRSLKKTDNYKVGDVVETVKGEKSVFLGTVWKLADIDQCSGTKNIPWKFPLIEAATTCERNAPYGKARLLTEDRISIILTSPMKLYAFARIDATIKTHYGMFRQVVYTTRKPKRILSTKNGTVVTDMNTVQNFKSVLSHQLVEIAQQKYTVLANPVGFAPNTPSSTFGWEAEYNYMNCIEDSTMGLYMGTMGNYVYDSENVDLRLHRETMIEKCKICATEKKHTLIIEIASIDGTDEWGRPQRKVNEKYLYIPKVLGLNEDYFTRLEWEN